MTPLDWAVLAIFAAVALTLAILARTAAPAPAGDPWAAGSNYGEAPF